MCWVSDVNMTKWNKLIQMLSNESQFFLWWKSCQNKFFYTLWEYRQLQPEETLVYKFVSKIWLSNLIK